MAPPRRTRLAVVLLAAVLALGLAAAALAGVTVYTNNFSGRAEAKQLKHTEGRHCEERWRRKAKSILVEVKKGPGRCGYRPPVEGDTPGPDHDFQAELKLLRATPVGIRRSAYMAVAVRSGKSSRYELRIFPKKHKYELRRIPAGGGGGFPKKGTSRAIKVNKPNVLRLKAVGNTVTARVNSKKVAQVTDSNPGQVDGRRLEVLVGNKRRTHKDVVASLDNLKLQVPSP
jgi:uncharacterized low-complexity protein